MLLGVPGEFGTKSLVSEGTGMLLGGGWLDGADQPVLH